MSGKIREVSVILKINSTEICVINAFNYLYVSFLIHGCLLPPNSNAPSTGQCTKNHVWRLVI